MTDFRQVIGLGVAGNFTGHLEQAGEAADFVNMAAEDAAAPKALFPFYLPKAPGARETFLHTYPLSSDRIDVSGTAGEKHQIEPEVCILCDIVYAEGRVASLVPRAFGAYNDCSIRRPGAKKISMKKNWGPDSKGVSAKLIPLDGFTADSAIAGYRIACFLKRDGATRAYGVDSAVRDYSYMFEKLLAWIAGRMNDQKDEGPAEDIAACLREAGFPARALVSIGATRYTEYGETHFLRPGDLSIVVVYDGRYTPERIAAMAGDAENGGLDADGISALVQKAV